MWRRFESSAAVSNRLPDAAYVELVDMVIRPVLPVAFMSVALISVGLLLASRKQDAVILVLTAVAAVVGVTSVFIVLAYRRRAAAAPIAGQEAKRWERMYDLAVFAFAVLLGAINGRALVIGHPPDSALVPMLTSGLAFVFGGGASSNVAFRPPLSLIATSLATGPTVVGFLYRATGATDPHVVAAFVLEAALLTGFAFAGVQWAGTNYETTRRQVVAKLDHAAMARRDALTGLANRVHLRERFEDAVEALRAEGDALAIHCLDLDRFKAVNDRYGHLVGDALLRVMSARLLGTLRDEDSAARLGGDEFVVIQTGIRHEDEARLLAHRIIRVLSAPYDIEGRDIRVGVSVGVALAPRDGVTLEALCARADAALYRAKREDRGGVTLWGEPPPPSAAAGP
jgi:diguanylate cyclase (GGDEF)-like protein